MALLADVVEQIDEAAFKAARAFLDRNMVLRAEPKHQARQLQALAIALGVLSEQYGVGEEQLVRLLRSAVGRVVDVNRCNARGIIEA